MREKYNIFISYRRDGGFETANLIYDRLTNCGYSVFLDVENLRSGKFNEHLYCQIDNCKDFLVVLGPNSLERCFEKDDWVRLEVAHAIKMNKNIIPVLLRNFKFPDTPLPDDIKELKNYQGVEASPEYFNASMKRIMDLLISNNVTIGKGIYKYIVYAFTLLLITIAVIFYFEWKERKHLVQVCKEVISLIATGFANGNELIATIDQANKEWKTFHANLISAKDPSEKSRLKNELNQSIDFKLQQTEDTSALIPWQLNPDYDKLLAKNGISTQDIKASNQMFRTDIKNTRDYLLRIKYWLNTPEMGWPDRLDESLDILAAMSKEMINSGIYNLNELILEMPESVYDTYNKFVPMFTNYYAEVDFHSTKKELEAKGERSIQNCGALLRDYSSIVGEDNLKVDYLSNKLDLLKSNLNKIHTEKVANPAIDSMKQSIAKKKVILTQKQAEVDEKIVLLRQSYGRILQKCSFGREEEVGMMWGKIIRLAQFGYGRIKTEKLYEEEYKRLLMNAQNAGKSPNTVKPLEMSITVQEVFQEVEKRLDLFLLYNKAKDPASAIYIPAAKKYYKLICEKKIEPSGILMIGTMNNLPHPFLKIGDIIIERKGKKIDQYETYAKLKDDPSPNILKVIRFSPSGENSVLEETISSDCKVLVGMLNLWDE